MQPNAEMSSGQATFDLKAARQMCAELPGRDKLPLPDRIDREERVLRLFPAALDEIGRLRKALALKTEQHKGQAHVIGSYLGMLADFNELNESQTKRIAELEADLEYYKSGFHSERGVHERVAAILGTDDAPWMLAQRAIERIAELEASLELEEGHTNSYIRFLHQSEGKRKKLHAALKKLGKEKRERGKALVEERARGNHYGMSYEDASDGEIERWIIDGEIDAPKVYIERMRVEARSQLRREGKL